MARPSACTGDPTTNSSNPARKFLHDSACAVRSPISRASEARRLAWSLFDHPCAASISSRVERRVWRAAPAGHGRDEGRDRRARLPVERAQIRERTGEGHKRVSKDRLTDEPVEELGHSLFARITRTGVNHETDDWPGDYDRLYALICKVVAQSNLIADAKPLLTRRLVERVAELERRWPKLKPR